MGTTWMPVATSIGQASKIDEDMNQMTINKPGQGHLDLFASLLDRLLKMMQVCPIFGLVSFGVKAHE